MNPTNKKEGNKLQYITDLDKEKLIVKKNKQIDDVLLDKIEQFDRTIFPIDNKNSFPDNYLKKLYKDSRDGIFVILYNDNVIGYTHCIFLSEDEKNEYLKFKDFYL